MTARRPKKSKVCRTCGRKFLGRASTKYCSPKCRPYLYTPAPKRKHVCPICSKNFLGAGQKRFCSKVCLDRATRERAQAERAKLKSENLKKRWTPAEDALLGQLSGIEAARQTSRTVRAVYGRRIELKRKRNGN